MNNAEFEKNLFIGSVISFSSLMLAKIWKRIQNSEITFIVHLHIQMRA